MEVIHVPVGYCLAFVREQSRTGQDPGLLYSERSAPVPFDFTGQKIRPHV